MATLTVTPNPANINQVVSVTGSGFEPRNKLRIRLDGVIVPISISRTDTTGGFVVQITVSSIPKTQLIEAQQVQRANIYVTAASTTVVVQSANTVPTVPQNLAGIAGNTTVALSWTAPVSDGGSTITSYRIYKNNIFLASTAGLTYTATNLTNGTSYTFAVSAVNSIGEGPKTATITRTPFAPPTAPSVPLNVSALAGNQQVTLTWSPPSSNGGSAILNYKVYRGTTLINSPTTTSYTDTGLTNGTAYTYQISAVNAVGEGPKSTAISSTPVAPPTGDTTPPIITNVVVSGITQTTVDISWHASEYSQGQVQYGTTTAYGSLTTKETSFLYQDHIQHVSGLTAGTLYHFRIWSADVAGNVALSGDFTFTTAGSVPGPEPPNTFTGDATGTTDVTSALNAWIAAQPDGAAYLATNAIYKISNPIRIARNNFELIGQGATTVMGPYSGCGGQSNFEVSGNDIIIRNLTAKGSHPNPGTYDELCEWNHGFEVLGGSNLEIDSCHALNNRGDGLYVTYAATGVHWHGGSVRGNGRMGIAVVHGINVLIDGITFDNIAYAVFDMEPNHTDQGAFDVTIRNTLTTGKGIQWLGIGGNGPTETLLVEDNVSQAAWGLYTYGWSPGPRRTNITVRNNVGYTDVDHGTGGRMYFTHTDGLTVTGNTIPGVGACVKAVNSTGVVVSGNIGCSPQTG